MGFVPVDEEARQAVRRSHGESLLVAAGAGTGKTTLLVDRIEALLIEGTARLDEIAAVTFTENAATTLKLRLRERLERARARGGDRAGHAGAALEALERAAVCTIHSLATTLLQERPLECAVLPGFRVADDAEQDLIFAEAWEEWLGEALARGDPALREALDAGIPLEGERGNTLRRLARSLVEQRDLQPLVGEPVDVASWRAEMLAHIEPLPDLLSGVRDDDTLATQLRALLAFGGGASFLPDAELVAHLAGPWPRLDRGRGRKDWWPSPAALEQGRAEIAWAQQALVRFRAESGTALHARLVGVLGAVAASYQRRKTARGVLDFLDLLLRARDALRGSPALQAWARRRFRYLIVDEFQDTDPLQVEIVELIAGSVPGALVVVGDAKQSIYRFRRADVAEFSRLARAGMPGRRVVHLTQSFRSRPALLRFVNRVFAKLISPEAPGQPDYEPIEPPPGLAEDAAVVALRFAAPLAEGDDLLRAEARALAACLAQLARGGLQVRDGEGLRESRPGDVMVLAPRLTKARALEEALEAHGLRFVVDGGRSFFDRAEVHEVLGVLRAIDDPSDRLALVAALRSAFLAVSDRDLAAYALSGGELVVGPGEPSRAGGESVAPALALLAELHQARRVLSVPALLDRLFDRTRVRAALTLAPRGEAAVANLDKVVALARQAGDLGALTLRGFVRALEERLAHAREEPDLPASLASDPQAVRILTIHKAKGLEAPIVALYDCAHELRTDAESVPLWAERRIAISFREGCRPPGWSGIAKDEEARARAEGRRLQYVACTRARDLLVIPRPPADARTGSFWRDLVKELPEQGDGDVRVVDADTLPVPAPVDEVADEGDPSPTTSDALAAAWERERKDLLQAAAERPYEPVAATRVAARSAPPPVAAPFSGRDFGSLVHRILEWIPLDRPDQAGPMARALADRFDLGRADAERAAAAVTRTLALPVLERARRSRRTFRELPVTLPEAGELAEGVIDLVFEEQGGLVVVDYKTDLVGESTVLAQAAHHAPQLRLYARALTLASGQKVRERLVLFTALPRAVPV